VIALPIHWPGEWRQALSDAALQQASSATIFQRAKAYVASGAVEVVGEDPMPEPALRGEVAGTDTYTTEVWIEDDAVAGACDCPHAEEGWFCKHQVALALVWRSRLFFPSPDAAALPPQAKQATPQRPRTAEDKRQALHGFLHSQPAAALRPRHRARASTVAQSP